MMLITLVTLMLINGADDDIDSIMTFHLAMKVIKITVTVMMILVVLIIMVQMLKHQNNKDKRQCCRLTCVV